MASGFNKIFFKKEKILKIINILIFLIFVFCGCSRELITSEERRAVETLCLSYNSENWETRRDTIRHICSYNIPQVHEVLTAALTDTHAGVRIEALKCIGDMKVVNAKRPVRQIAEFENDDNIKLYALQALTKYRDPFSAPVFAKGLQSNDWLIREESIKGILMINDPLIQQTSVSYFLQALKDERVNVRLAALENVKIKNEKIYKELALIITDQENKQKVVLLKAALKALNGYLLDNVTRARIIDLLTHADAELRVLSLGVLKKDKELQDREFLRW
jgi:HEAT repeat protein